MSRQSSTLPSLVDERSSAIGAGGTPGAGPSAAQRAAKKQRLMAIASVVVLLASGGFIYWQLFGGPPSIAEETSRRDLIDAKTGKVFEKFRIPPNSRAPYTNPDTGEATLFPAERCFWTRDGKAKVPATLVLLNEYAGKPGDTICPDCGRKVVPRNPMPPPAVMSQLNTELTDVPR